MKITTMTSLAIALGFAYISHADVIAVYDAGGVADGSDAGPIEDLSTGGDNIGGITGSFSSSANADFATTVANQGRWGNNEFDFSPGSTTVAAWTFSNLTPGSPWEVFVSWSKVSQGNLSSVAPYTVQGGSIISIDQRAGAQVAPDLTLNDGTEDVPFVSLGSTTADGSGDLVVTLTGTSLGGSNWVIADAVAIRLIPEPSSMALLGLGGLALMRRRQSE